MATVIEEIVELILPTVKKLINSDNNPNYEQKGLDIYKNPRIHCVQEVVDDETENLIRKVRINGFRGLKAYVL